MDRLKILVVDDESRMRKLVRDFLVKSNFEVLEAEDGEQAVDIFKEVVAAGVEAGVDLVFIETVADLLEARAALLAVKETCSLPVMVTMTYEERCRTFLGHSPAAAALTLEGLGADAIGVNCSLGPREMPPLAEELLKRSSREDDATVVTIRLIGAKT